VKQWASGSAGGRWRWQHKTELDEDMGRVITGGSSEGNRKPFTMEKIAHYAAKPCAGDTC